jgi:hypothetical protein
LVFSDPEPPSLYELQGILEGIYHSNLYDKKEFASRVSSRGTTKQNKRGNVISRRAGTAGTGGAYSLKEWHALLENHGIGTWSEGRWASGELGTSCFYLDC